MSSLVIVHPAVNRVCSPTRIDPTSAPRRYGSLRDDASPGERSHWCTTRSAARPSPQEIDDGQQNYGADEADSQGRDTEVVLIDCANTHHGRNEITSDQRPDDTNDDVQDYSLLSVGFHDDAREPTDDAADNEPDDEIHV